MTSRTAEHPGSAPRSLSRLSRLRRAEKPAGRPSLRPHLIPYYPPRGVPLPWAPTCYLGALAAFCVDQTRGIRSSYRVSLSLSGAGQLGMEGTRVAPHRPSPDGTGRGLL